MKRTALRVAILAVVAAALAATFLIDWNPVRSRREAFIYRCNEEGGGGTFTSREYCKALYEAHEARARRNSN